MDGSTNDMPRVYGIEEASHRADFKLEEIVEFLYASSGGDKRVFWSGCSGFACCS